MSTVYPDKHSKKCTTTTRLREHIISVGKDLTYLEVGCARGFTILSVAHVFKKSTGLDIVKEQIDESNLNLSSRLDLQGKVRFIEGDLQWLTKEHFDVVFIDANHKYKNVRSDLRRVVKLNTAERYRVIFHDYGLVDAGVRRLVDQFFLPEEITFVGELEDWNPEGGSIDGPEAVEVWIDEAVRARLSGVLV